MSNELSTLEVAVRYLHEIVVDWSTQNIDTAGASFGFEKVDSAKCSWMYTEPSLAVPEAFKEVKIDDLYLLEADDIDKKLKFLQAFWCKMATISDFGQEIHLLKTNQRLKISSPKYLNLLVLSLECS